MATIEELTAQIDELKKEMDNHPKNSDEYSSINDTRNKLMKQRTRLRNKSKKDDDNTSVSSSNSRRAKVVKILEDTKSEASTDDEYLETMKYIAEQEAKYQEVLTASGPSELIIDPAPEQNVPQPIQQPSQEEALKIVNEFVQDLKKELPKRPIASFVDQPVNEAITKQFLGPQGVIPKETLIGDIYKLQAVMGIHPTEDLKELSYEDLQMKLKEVSAKFRAKKHTVSELLANLHVVGLTAILNLSNPMCEETAGFTFANVQENAEEAKPMLISCYDELIQEDPVLGKYLMTASSGAVGLLSASTVIAAKSFSTDEKKFTGVTQKK